MTSPTSAVNVVVTLQSRPEGIEALAEVLRELTSASRRQPGNRRFEVHQQGVDPSQFITIEQWDSVAAADAHMTGAHVGVALGKLGDLLTGPPQIVRYAQVV